MEKAKSMELSYSFQKQTEGNAYYPPAVSISLPSSMLRRLRKLTLFLMFTATVIAACAIAWKWGLPFTG